MKIIAMKESGEVVNVFSVCEKCGISVSFVEKHETLYNFIIKNKN